MKQCETAYWSVKSTLPMFSLQSKIIFGHPFFYKEYCKIITHYYFESWILLFILNSRVKTKYVRIYFIKQVYKWNIIIEEYNII